MSTSWSSGVGTPKRPARPSPSSSCGRCGPDSPRLMDEGAFGQPSAGSSGATASGRPPPVTRPGTNRRGCPTPRRWFPQMPRQPAGTSPVCSPRPAKGPVPWRYFARWTGDAGRSPLHSPDHRRRGRPGCSGPGRPPRPGVGRRPRNARRPRRCSGSWPRASGPAGWGGGPRRQGDHAVAAPVGGGPRPVGPGHGGRPPTCSIPPPIGTAVSDLAARFLGVEVDDGTGARGQGALRPRRPGRGSGRRRGRFGTRRGPGSKRCAWPRWWPDSARPCSRPWPRWARTGSAPTSSSPWCGCWPAWR